jgi:uncharacterized membrane protein YdbT with pleckstrin-like domain
MSYTEKSLIAGETILYKTGLHWIVLLGPGVLSGFLVLFGFGALIGKLFVLGIGFLGAATLTIGLAILARNATEMAVTNKRILIKWGLLKTDSLELFLSKVETIGVDQGFLKRTFGYGTVIVKGTGGTNEPFVKVRTPLEFRRQVAIAQDGMSSASI